MITLNITIGGNLEISLNKGAKEELKELIEKASNTDDIIADLLESSHYLGNDWHDVRFDLSEAPAIGRGSFYVDEEETVEDYTDIWFYPDYVISSFAETLLRDKKVIFKKV